MSIKTKIFFLITIVVVISFLVVTLVVTDRSIEMAKKDAYNLAQERAEKYKNEILAELQNARVTSETLKTVMETLKDYGLNDRDMMNDLLKNTLAEKKAITAFCVAYDPDALDGKDAEYAGVGPLYDETGRYAPYWNRLGEHIEAEPLYDIDIADWYIMPRETMREYITDPYPYHVQGQTVMLASFVFPLIHDGEFIGIIATDIVLDKLQEMVSHVNTDEWGGITEIYSNSGVVVAHPDKDYLGQDMIKASVYTMLKMAPATRQAALENARAYAAPAGAEGEGYADPSLFVENLEAYVASPDTVGLDLSLLTPGMARAMLEADPTWLDYTVEVREAIRGGERYISNNDAYYTVYAPIQFSEDTNPWSVAVSLPMEAVLGNATGIRDFVIMVFVASILILALVLYLITDSVTKPIVQLTRTARTIGEGDFDVEIPSLKGNNEITVLSKAIKTMAVKINDLITSLQDYAHELEQKNIHLKDLNEMLIIAKEEAEASSRAKGNFLSNMSHEMRTPMNAIIGMTSIGSSTDDVARKDYAFGKITEASSHLLGVINDVLDMSKIEANKLELNDADFSFPEMIRKTLEVMCCSMEAKGQKLSVSIDPAIPERLRGDEQRLSQVFTNLLSNAVKFTPEHGSIRVEARLLEQSDAGCALECAVEDTGIGIDDSQQARLFSSFEQADNTTSRKYGGTGLGLAITKSIVEMMEGSIAFTSTPGKGTRFTFTVRLARAAATETPPPQTGDPGQDNTMFDGKFALLAEDVEINQEIVVALLEPLGITVECADNGREAVRMFSENPEHYDLIFMDVQMPEMDGMEATRRIRALDTPRAGEIPIISMTANVFKEDIERYMEIGMNDHVGKPLSFDVVLEKLRRYL
ncbi:response regulator [Eubacteriales bacterium OttesenSCG-928-A19]|nr:response regulator [Eubacteriales bacterium OttesenSCG-928-A19]